MKRAKSDCSTVTFRISAKLKKLCEEECEKSGRSLSTFVRTAMEERVVKSREERELLERTFK